MPRARVFVKATFVSTKAAKTPSVVIERPDDISELVGDICCKGYDLLKYRLAEIVKDTTNSFWFQKDETYLYTFDESSLPNGGIYGMKERRSEDSDLAAKLTASKLIPLKCARDFDRNVTSAATVKYRLGGRRKVRKPEHYTVELCVVLIREKRKKVAPVSSIVCPSTATLSSRTGGQKRKSPPPAFTFQAKKVCITLFAPIETEKKKTGVRTGVPPGKTSKELMFDLGTFIVGGVDDDSDDSSPSLDDADDNGDERFDDTLTLSFFCKELMVLAMNGFPEEYSILKKSLGRRCKLFVQKQWNLSSWLEVPNTEVFIRLLKEQMCTKSRVTDNTVHIRFSFGRAKAGLEFVTEEDFHGYCCADFGEGIHFSQSEVPASPIVRQVGAVKRDECWNKPARVADLVAGLYKNEKGKLYHGFLKEHGNSFFKIISADLSIRKDTSAFLPFLNDPTKPITNEFIDNSLLPIFIRSHINDIVGNPMPETKKYPPTNETMMVMPPTLCEWKATQLQTVHLQQLQHVTPPYHHLSHNTIPSSSLLPNNIDDVNGEITALTFRASWDDDLEVSVIIEDTLSSNSTMAIVMEHGDVFDDLCVRADTISSYKFVVAKKNGGKLTFKWKKFMNVTVNTLIRISNIDDDYVITLKDSNN